MIVLLGICVLGQAQNQKAVRVNPNELKKAERISDGPIEFTLRNESLKSIPLWIPGVMNPNLSPKSSSGVGLRIGQKVYFKYKGKKEVLFEVKDSYDTRVIEVSKLVKDRGLQLEYDKKNKKNGRSETSMEDEEKKSRKKSKKSKKSKNK